MSERNFFISTTTFFWVIGITLTANLLSTNTMEPNEMNTVVNVMSRMLHSCSCIISAGRAFPGNR